MKLTTTTQVSVDGVMQGPGGPEEDERGVFERGGWAHFDNEAGTVMDEIYQRADAFLFGRLTYEIFAGSWGTWDDPGDSPIWTALNTKPKYVASTTLTDPRWTNTTVLASSVAAAVRLFLGLDRVIPEARPAIDVALRSPVAQDRDRRSRRRTSARENQALTGARLARRDALLRARRRPQG